MALQSTNIFSGQLRSDIGLVRVCFPGVEMTDTVNWIGSTTGAADYTVAGTVLVSDLPNVDSRFWIEVDINQVEILCTFKSLSNPNGNSVLQGDFATAQTVVAVPMLEVDFVGGRPIVVR